MEFELSGLEEPVEVAEARGVDRELGLAEWTLSDRLFAFLHFFHHKVVVASHTTYPAQLMFGRILFGNILLRKACDGNRYPSLLVGYALGFVCYIYPSAIATDVVLLGEPARTMGNNAILLLYTMHFFIIQSFPSIYRFLTRPFPFALLNAWWLADATRGSLVFLELVVSQHAVFARGIFHAVLWVSAGPILGILEARVRGGQPQHLEEALPNSMNVFRYASISSLFTMLFYLLYLTWFSDCNMFGRGGLTMVECGKQYDGLFAGLVYLNATLHLARSLTMSRGAKGTKGTDVAQFALFGAQDRQLGCGQYLGRRLCEASVMLQQ